MYAADFNITKEEVQLMRLHYLQQRICGFLSPEAELCEVDTVFDFPNVTSASTSLLDRVRNVWFETERGKKQYRANVKWYLEQKRVMLGEIIECIDYLYRRRVKEPWQQQQATEWFIDHYKERKEALEVTIRKCEFILKSSRKNFKPKYENVPMETIKSVKIEDLIGIQPQRKNGNRWLYCCPFHVESTASFTYYVDQNTFHCYGCQKNGSVIDYVMYEQHVTLSEAIKILVKML